MTGTGTEEHTYGEYSPFVRLLETPGRVRILDVFLRRFESELSASDIAHLVSESTFSRNKDVLLELGVINQTREVAGKKYYQLNRDSELVKLLGQFHTQLIVHSSDIVDGTDTLQEEYIGSVLATRATKASGSAAETAEGSRFQPREVLKSLGYLEGTP